MLVFLLCLILECVLCDLFIFIFSQSMDSTLHYIHNDSDLSTNSSFSPEEERKSKVQVNYSDFWFSYM